MQLASVIHIKFVLIRLIVKNELDESVVVDVGQRHAANCVAVEVLAPRELVRERLAHIARLEQISCNNKKQRQRI